MSVLAALLRIWPCRLRGWVDHHRNRRNFMDPQPALLRDVGLSSATPLMTHRHFANAEAQSGMLQ